MACILVVDDEVGIRELLSEILYDEGHTVELAENAAAARQVRAAMRPDLVLLDIWMPDTDGVSLLKEWASSGQLTMPVVMMSGHATIDTAVEATRIGAIDFLEKPITLQRLLKTVSSALERARLGLLRPVASPTQNRGTSVSSAASTGPVPTSASQGMTAAALGSADPQSVQVASVPVELVIPPVRAVPGTPGATVSGAEIELDKPLREARDDFERIYFEHHLIREGGSMSRVAARTGLERTHLYRKLKQLGIDLGRRRNSEPEA